MKLQKTNLTFKNTLSKRPSTKRIVIHHADAKKCDAKTIHGWHLNNGWSGIGYHFLVRKEDGIVEVGRPIDTIGAHASNNNSDSIGICFEGNFETETMSDLQLQTGKELIEYIRGIYGDLKIVKHKDLMATSCPGKNFPFDKLIAKVEEKKEDKKNTTYTVKKGDTLSRVGQSLNIKWQDIASLNGIKSPYTIQIGQVLKISNGDVPEINSTTTTKTTTKKAYTGTFPTLPKRGYFQKGDKGMQIKYLQKFLNWYGNYGLVVDGDFGNKTLSAVQSFQKKEKLTVDGLFGKASLSKAKTIKK